MKGFAAYEKLRNSASLERLHVFPSDVDSEFFEATKEDADVLRLDAPSAALQKPLDVGRDDVRKTLLDRFISDPSETVWFRDGQSDESRPISGSVVDLEQYPVIGRNPEKEVE